MDSDQFELCSELKFPEAVFWSHNKPIQNIVALNNDDICFAF